MIDVPAIGGDITLLEGVAAVAIFVTGYVVHETLHVIPLWAWGHSYSVEILPTDDGQSKLTALFMGTVVEITTVDSPPRSHVIVSALAPGVMALFPLAGLVVAFSYPVVDIGTLLVLGAWFAVAIPSARDWLTVFQYGHERTVKANTEVH